MRVVEGKQRLLSDDVYAGLSYIVVVNTSLMGVSDIVLAAIVAASISLLISIVGFVASYLQVKSSRRRLERELRHSFTDKVYEHRIRLYPEGLQITSRIKRRKRPQYLDPPEVIKSIKDDLNRWGEGEAGLFMSGKSVQAYWKLRDELRKNPGLGERYTEKQSQNIWKARVEFRRQLRRDLGNLYDDDWSKDSSPQQRSQMDSLW